MAVSGSGLADEIRIAMGFPTPVSTQLTGWATGTLDELTISGTAGFGGVAGPHSITGMTGSSMATRVETEAGYPSVSTELTNFCTALVDYIQSNAVVTYTGPTPPPPPGFTDGGTISGMVGDDMADDIHDSVGFPGSTSTPLKELCGAIVDHIQANAQVASGVIS